MRPLVHGAHVIWTINLVNHYKKITVVDTLFSHHNGHRNYINVYVIKSDIV
jgi:hypothetical protein